MKSFPAPSVRPSAFIPTSNRSHNRTKSPSALAELNGANQRRLLRNRWLGSCPFYLFIRRLQVAVSIPKANRRSQVETGSRLQVAVSIPKANRRSQVEQDFRLEVGVKNSSGRIARDKRFDAVDVRGHRSLLTRFKTQQERVLNG